MSGELSHPTLTLAGGEYVLVPREEYLRLLAGAASPDPDGASAARALLDAEAARTLRALRDAAGLSQAELAKRIGWSQAHVSRAESGLMTLTAEHLARWRRACGSDGGGR